MAPAQTRRSLLAGAGAAAAGLRVPGATALPFFQAHHLKLGVQLYTVAQAASRDLAGTLRAIAAMGYRSVESLAMFGKTPEAFKSLLQANGLLCPSMHVFRRGTHGGGLDGDLIALTAAAHLIGARYIINAEIPVPPRLAALRHGETYQAMLARIQPLMTVADWQAHAAYLNNRGAALRRRGLTLGYHSHDFDFAPLPGGRTGAEILMAETDPALVTFEIDVGWVRAAGIDPVTWLRAHPGRFRLMHVKDIAASTPVNYTLHITPAPIGQGAIQWAPVLRAGLAAGVRDYFVEQDPPYTKPAMQVVRDAYSYLHTLRA